MKKSKRNLLTIVVLSMLIVTITIFVASCNRHEHSFNEAWTSDATGHYHDASCEHTELISNKAPHTFGEAEIVSQASCTENGLKKYTCTVCQYVKEETIPQTGHAYSSEYQKDEYGHWVIANCEHTTVVGEKRRIALKVALQEKQPVERMVLKHSFAQSVILASTKKFLC